MSPITAPRTPSEKAAVARWGPLMPYLSRRLDSEYGAIALPDLRCSGEDLAGVRVLVASNSSVVDVDTMAMLPGLEAILVFGVGYESVDLDAARGRGVVLANTPGVLNDCVADVAMGLALAASRGIASGDRFIRRGAWHVDKFGVTHRFSGSNVGIVGLGRIGSAIASRLEGFNCSIRYHNRRPVPGCPYPYSDSLVELASWARILIIAAAADASSPAIVDSSVLAELGPEGVLINVARGSVVDERAMIDALTSGRLKAAGLDVFAGEPDVAAELIALDNVVITPHVGSRTYETRQAMAELVLENLASYLQTGRLLTSIGNDC